MELDFLKQTIEVERTPPKFLSEKAGLFELSSEKLKVTIELVGYGNTTEISTNELLQRIMDKIGDGI